MVPGVKPLKYLSIFIQIPVLGITITGTDPTGGMEVDGASATGDIVVSTDLSGAMDILITGLLGAVVITMHTTLTTTLITTPTMADTQTMWLTTEEGAIQTTTDQTALSTGVQMHQLVQTEATRDLRQTEE